MKYPPLVVQDTITENKMQWEITPLFSQCVSISFIQEEVCAKLKSICKTTEWLEDNSESGENGAVSKNRFVLNDHVELNDYFKSVFCSYLKGTIGYDTDVQITTSWFTKTNPNGFCLEHTHCNSWYSAVVYFDEYDEQSSRLEFIGESTQILVEPIEYNFLNSTKWKITPHKGMVVIFPSGTWHKVLRGKNLKTRHSMAINVMPKGSVGNHDSSFEY